MSGKHNKQERHSYPLERANIESKRFSLFEIKRWVENGSIQASNFQRESGVWNLKQKSELIESILCGIPLPAVYLSETKEHETQIIDGKQRIETFVDFMNDGFSLSSCLSIVAEIAGKKFSELNNAQKRKIQDYQIAVYEIPHHIPEYIKSLIFARVNL
ncbi:hypothetical protein CQA49_08710 [Helicobacter sp. MIT 00-7814]|uniref:DUF262 domain-containing protein n=1 Tax=unclassified Helicobacter TaxID=2593540 RepID=UPI000E1F4995|nr:MULTISPECIES: DUF262 domain-containing protein [unclassified Helicobacter]RDU52130.1 hypothetical protein CQA49_08710 [Helicobacter sp. MIT 00-7814]RDU56777.1 hypothetical protein CQA37_01355 [Helicobacter sp. MIT 99-10781]